MNRRTLVSLMVLAGSVSSVLCGSDNAAAVV